MQHHLYVLLSDGEKEGGKLFFQYSQFWTKQFETAKIALTCSFPPWFSLALTSEGPEAPHNPKLAALTPTASTDIFVFPLWPNKPQDVFAFLSDLANFTDIYPGSRHPVWLWGQILFGTKTLEKIGRNPINLPHTKHQFIRLCSFLTQRWGN